MENDKQNIGEFIAMLVNPSCIAERIRFYMKLRKDGNYVLKNFRTGPVSEKLLLALLKKSVYNNTIKLLIPDILYYIEPSSITDTVILYCLNYPGIFRNTLLVQLAHMWLTIEQLEIINHNIQTPEAFCKLFLLYAENEGCSIAQFEQFLHINASHLDDVDLIEIIVLNEIHISKEKMQIVNRITHN